MVVWVLWAHKKDHLNCLQLIYFFRSGYDAHSTAVRPSARVHCKGCGRFFLMPERTVKECCHRWNITIGSTHRFYSIVLGAQEQPNRRLRRSDWPQSLNCSSASPPQMLGFAGFGVHVSPFFVAHEFWGQFHAISMFCLGALPDLPVPRAKNSQV